MSRKLIVVLKGDVDAGEYHTKSTGGYFCGDNVDDDNDVMMMNDNDNDNKDGDHNDQDRDQDDEDDQDDEREVKSQCGVHGDDGSHLALWKILQNQSSHHKHRRKLVNLMIRQPCKSVCIREGIVQYDRLYTS